MRCDVPDPPANGRVYSRAQSVPVFDSIAFKCFEGYKIRTGVFAVAVQCQPNGTFTFMIQACNGEIYAIAVLKRFFTKAELLKRGLKETQSGHLKLGQSCWIRLASTSILLTQLFQKRFTSNTTYWVAPDSNFIGNTGNDNIGILVIY